MDIGSSPRIKKITACALLFSLVGTMISPVFAAVSPDFIATETVAGYTPVDDQAAVTSVTQAHAAETKASRTLQVSTRPASATSITIGQCVVTFMAIAGTTSDELDCADNLATIDTNTGVGNANRTPATIAGRLRAISDVSDTNHGALTLSGGGANAIFTTSGDETSTTIINFSDSTSGSISSTASTTGIPATAKISTLTIGASVEVGDSFTAIFGGGNSATFVATTTNPADVASGLNAAVQAHALYPTAPFTSSVASNIITFTAKTPGTNFSQTSTTTNAAVSSQVVTFTPVDVVSGIVYTSTIDGANYTYTTDATTTVSNVTAALAVDMTTGGVATCTNNTTHISCVNNTPGSSFAFGASIMDIAAPVITLNGSNPMDTSHGTAYAEPGATCVDNVDPSCSVVIDNSSVNTTLVGPYSVSYNAVDTLGNTAIQILRTVNVVDTDKPIITLLGTSTVIVAQGSSYVDAGATATDNVDGDITANIVINGSVDTSTLGNYLIAYDVSDAVGNVATQVTRTISVTDQTAPTLTEVTVVPTPTNDNTPFYTFSTDEAGTITYGGGCTSSTTSASIGSNTIELNALADNTYAACTITVTDSSSNTSVPLVLTTFVVDTTDPSVTIEQSMNQMDPTTGSQMIFTTVFAEPIVESTFACDDIVLVNATCVNIVPLGSNTYTINVLATTFDGVISASINGGVVSDLAGNTNTASTSIDNTITITLPAGGPTNFPGGPTVPNENPAQEETDNDGELISWDDEEIESSETESETEEEDDFLDRDGDPIPMPRPEEVGTESDSDENENPETWESASDDNSELVSTSFPNDASTPTSRPTRPNTQTINNPVSTDTSVELWAAEEPQEAAQPEVVKPQEEIVTQDVGGGQPREESSNILPWTLLGVIALLNFAWFYTRKPPMPPQG